MKKVIVICGPTSIGKSKLAFELAQIYQTDIINGDAFQIYQKMNIGTAKPSVQERQKVKHHLSDCLDPLENFSIYEYQQMVRKIINDLHNEDKIVLLVGGSGLYLDAVIYDYRLEGQGRSQILADELKDQSNEEVHAILKDLNPTRANEIHPNNRKRVIRAIELSFNQSEKRDLKDVPLYDCLYIFLHEDRQKLYQNIDARVDLMFALGLVEEVKELYPDQIGPQALKAIGYKELYSYFKHEITLDEARAKIKQATRNFAKRQWTWYAKRKDITRIMIERENFALTIAQVQKMIDEFLNN